MKRNQEDFRIPLESRELIKQLAANFPAPTMLETSRMEPRELAFRAGCRYLVELLIEGQAADDADEEADKDE